jgi:phosphoribosylamine--glycine ligase
MKVLVIGSGGREHALCCAFSKSSKIEKIYCAPGNGGTSEIAENVNIGVSDFDKLSDFAKSSGVDFTFVGPEIPLAQGIVDFFEKKGLKIAGPSQQASQLESSKIYSKQFMDKYGIPTARYKSFSVAADALRYLEEWEENKKAVVKADGLAAGKGVYICSGREEAKTAVKQIMDEKVLGEAGSNVVIEEFIDGQELSFLIFTDGTSFSMMPASQDHKRINDNDEGPNTGGMGAYAPAPLADEALTQTVKKDIIEKVIAGLKSEKLKYKGVLYVGVIMNGDKPYVLEFNCRFGDPETQAVLPLLKTDFADICAAIIDEKLGGLNIEWDTKTAVCVVLASGGYPGKFENGFEINGLGNITDEDTIVFHAGTKLKDGKLITSGGRVLGITSIAGDIKSAIKKAYENIEKVSFENMHYRKDIAQKALAGEF